MTLAALLLVACSPTDSDAKPADNTAPTGDSADTGEPGDTGAEPFAADELEDTLEALLASAMQVSAPAVIAAYQAGMAGADATCPTFYETDTSRYWSDVCTAESGTRFDGGGGLYEDTSAADGARYVTTTVLSEGTIRPPDAAALTLDGQVTVSRADADDGSYVTHSSLVYGTFTLDDGGPDWLRSGLEAQLVVSGQYQPASGGRAGYLDGGLFAMEGAFPDVLFDGLLLVDAAAGGACPTEPGGVITVKDAETGDWWDITFDGAASLDGAVVDPARCDGCGEVRLYGELLGEVCLDFSALTNWGEAPW